MTCTVITDLQLSEQSAIPGAQEQRATLSPGIQTQVFEQMAETTQW